MASFEKTRLRNVLRRLRAADPVLDPNTDRGEVAQEMLDLFAVTVGLKPVFLLGRGLDDAKWIAAALDASRRLGLRIFEGPIWDAMRYGSDIPGWYADHIAAETAALRVWYVCKTQVVEQEIQRIFAQGGRLTVEEEAVLLAYPECCVAAHYGRALSYHRATLAILDRLAAGEEGKMRSFLRDGVSLEPETESEKAAFNDAYTVAPAPFGNWNMCAQCFGIDYSPSARLSGRFRALAESVDGNLAAVLTLKG